MSSKSICMILHEIAGGLRILSRCLGSNATSSSQPLGLHLFPLFIYPFYQGHHPTIFDEIITFSCQLSIICFEKSMILIVNITRSGLYSQDLKDAMAPLEMNRFFLMQGLTLLCLNAGSAPLKTVNIGIVFTSNQTICIYLPGGAPLRWTTSK